MRQRGNFQPHGLAGDGRHFDLAAHDRRRHRQRHLHVEVAPLALEHRVRSEVHAQVEVAGCCAALAVFAFTRDADARPVADARGDAHVNRARVAVVIQREAPRRDMEGVLEGELDLVLDVATLAGSRAPAIGARPARAGAGLALSETAAAEERREEVGERMLISEHLLHFLRRHRPEAAAALAATTAVVDVPLSGEWIRPARAFRLFVCAPVGAKLVVFPAFLRIAEDFVRLVDLLELRFSSLVVRIDVGVMLPRQLPEGLLDLLLRGALIYAERCVVILEFHLCEATLYAPPTMSLRRRISDISCLRPLPVLSEPSSISG